MPRKLLVAVPDDAVPGETKIRVDPGDDAFLVITIPPLAAPGDQLILTEDESNCWSVGVRRSAVAAKHGSSVASSSLPGRRQLELRVPRDAQPGQTTLEVEVGEEGEKLRIGVPAEAQPEDRILLSQSTDGKWVCSFERGSGCAKSCPGQATASSGAGHAQYPGQLQQADCDTIANGNGATAGIKISLRKTRLQIDSESHFRRLVEMATAAGAYVNPKVTRGAVPPLMVPGLLAREAIEEGEVLMEMPMHLTLCYETLHKGHPSLVEAVESLTSVSADRRRGVAVSACIANLFQMVADRAAAGKRSDEGSGDAWPSLWYCYAEGLLGEDFRFHPYWKSIIGDDFRKLMEPSGEAEYARTAASALCADHRCLMDGPPKDVMDPCFELGLFFHAHMCLLSREWMTPHGLTLIPVLDLFNHSHAPGARQYWYMEKDKMVIKALRAHAAGEELFISYESLSNPTLYRQYGFTMPPSLEPKWSCCMCESSELHALCDVAGKMEFTGCVGLQERLAERLQNHPHLELSSTCLAEPVSAALDVFGAALNDSRGTAPHVEHAAWKQPDEARLLLEVLAHKAARYEQDPSLQHAIAGLRRAREVDRSSGDWWSELVTSSPSADTGVDEENALRVKMSEYLCLLAHQEALDLVAGRIKEADCLQAAKQLRLDVFARWGAKQ